MRGAEHPGRWKKSLPRAEHARAQRLSVGIRSALNAGQDPCPLDRENTSTQIRPACGKHPSESLDTCQQSNPRRLLEQYAVLSRFRDPAADGTVLPRA